MARDSAATLYHGTTAHAQSVYALLCSKTEPASGSRSQQGATFQPDLHTKGDVKWPSGEMSFSDIMREGSATNFIKFSLWSNKQKSWHFSRHWVSTSQAQCLLEFKGNSTDEWGKWPWKKHLLKEPATHKAYENLGGGHSLSFTLPGQGGSNEHHFQGM